MKNILITGGTGLIGKYLSIALIQLGYRVTLLSRSKSVPGKTETAFWDPSHNVIDSRAVAEADVIIHLAGTNIGTWRWTSSRKRSIISSRVDTCRLLFNEVRKSGHQELKLFISASGVGYYGAVTNDHIYTETDSPGTDYLAETCRQWEQAASEFSSLGVRTVIFRNGLNLAGRGGIIQRLYLPFNLGFGTTLGKGNQYLPWIHIQDLCDIYGHAVNNEQMAGVYNAVAPQHITFSDFSKELAASMGRKMWLPAIPAVLLKAALGEMSEIVLEGSRVSNEKLENTGFHFRYPDLKSAMENIIKIQR
jgi:uncharacterized protein (TIGR01777 family)